MSSEHHKAGRMATLALGWAGIVPFLLCAGALSLGWQEVRAGSAFVAYGAVILSFLGGIRWGQAVLERDSPSAWALKLSVIPPLLGWLALLLPGMLPSMLLLIAGFGLMLWLDVFSRVAIGPDHFRGLRLQLSVAVLVIHLGMLLLLMR